MRANNSAEALINVGKRFKELNHSTCAGGTAESLETAVQLAAAATELVAALAREVAET
jgi:hypothetical protein